LTEIDELTARIKAENEKMWTLLRRAYSGRAWKALGYGSWRAYVDIELKRLDREVLNVIREWP
jgi:hypothetical protein